MLLPQAITLVQNKQVAMEIAPRQIVARPWQTYVYLKPRQDFMEPLDNYVWSG